MDKNLNVRRGLSRFSPAKQHLKQSVRQKLFSDNGVGGDSVSLEKSKKHRLRRLSVVGKESLSEEEDCEMGCDVIDIDDKVPSDSPLPSSVSSQKFKLPRKVCIDNNGVDYALVPRKLRSAMKKRNHESISPPLPESKKQNNSSTGVKSSKRNGMKKFKTNMKLEGSSGSQKQNVSGPITKDEEEVVETLYALAGMFPRKDETHISKLEAESFETNISALPREMGSDEPAFGGSGEAKDDLKPFGQTAEAVNTPLNLEASRAETMLFNTTNKSSVKEECDMHVGHFSTGSESSVPKVDMRSINFLSETKPVTEKTMGRALDFGVLSDLSFDTSGWKQPKQQEMSLPERMPELSLRPISKADRRSWKRCATHVFITRLIQVSRKTERKDRLKLQPDQLKQNEGAEQGVLIAHTNGVMSTSGVQSSSAEANFKEANGTLQYKMLYQDQQHTAPASGLYPLQKQSFDFLSLLAGGGGVEANVGVDRSREGLEPMSQLHVPGLRSLSQHQTRLPFPVTETHYPSSMDPGHVSSAAQQVQRQVPTYLNSTFITPPDPSSTALATQQRHSQQQQPQRQQQRLWPAQLDPQFRPVSAAMTLFPNWQNGRPESHAPISLREAIFDPPSSGEVLRSKYGSLSQHQQQITPITSSILPARLTKQSHHLPSPYEETGGTFPLQLLCNNRL